MALRNLVVRMGLDSAGLKKGLSSSQRELKKFKGQLASAGKIAAGIGAGFAAAGIGKLLRDSVADASKFNSSIADLKAITGAAGDDLAFLTEQSKKFGRESTLSAGQAAEAFKLVASAKPDLLENVKALSLVTGEAIKLAEATGSTLPDAAKILGTSLNQFQADAKDAGRFINVLAAGAKFGASEVLDSAEALRKAGVQASLAGISFEEANAAIQVVAAGGIKAEEAGTALRNIFIELEKQADRNLKPSVVGLGTAFQNLAAQNRSSTALVELFGKKAAAAGQLLVRGADKIDEYKEKLTGTNTATDQATIKVNTLAGDILSLGSAYEGLAISIGEKAEPQNRKFIQQLTAIISAIRELNGEQSAFAGIARVSTFVIAGLAKFLNEARIQFAQLATIASASIRLIEIASGSFRKAVTGKGDEVVTDFQNIVAQTQAALKALTDEKQNFEDTVDFGKGLADIIKAAETVKNLFADLKDKPVTGVIEPPPAPEIFDPDADKKRQTALERAQEQLKAYNRSVLEGSELVRQQLLEDLKNLDDISAKFPEIGAEANRLRTELALEAGRDIAELKKTVETTAKEMSEFAKQAARNMQDAFASFLFDPFEDGVKGMLKSFANTIRQMVAQAAAARIFKSIGATGFGKAIAGFFGGSVPGKALGGPVKAGGAYIVGEKGPELFTPGANSGFITPNNKLGGGGTVLNFNNTVNASSSADEGTIRRLLNASNETVKAEIVDMMQRGLIPT